MRRVLAKLMMLFLPFGGIVLWVNFYVDPANLFSDHSYTKGIASIMIKGHNVDNVSNYDERLLQKEIITGIQETPDIVVIGSSRVMEVDTGLFPGQKLRNLSVSHGNIHDLIAIIGILDSMNRLPKGMILEIDPAMLVPNESQEWKVLTTFHHYTMKNLLKREFDYGPESIFLDRRMVALFSIQYFQDAVRFWSRGRAKQYEDVGLSAPLSGGRFSNGVIAYPEYYRMPDTLKVNEDAAREGRKTRMAPPTSGMLELYRDLLQLLKGKSVQVKLVMVPYHPAYYAGINRNSDNALVRAEDLFREMAEGNHIEILGSLNPDKVHVTGHDFYDRWHCNKIAIGRLFGQ
ncbi:MAG TPA: hypothetical protein PLX35_05960 [Cyclobacteriaceae bacterium]|nr:hypothetical protein [Cyclobacteriaceae bacterium]